MKYLNITKISILNIVKLIQMQNVFEFVLFILTIYYYFKILN